MENYQKGDFERRPEVWLNGNMHKEKRIDFFTVSATLVFVRKINAPAPPMFYYRELVLNMFVKFSSRVQVRSDADMDG